MFLISRILRLLFGQVRPTRIIGPGVTAGGLVLLVLAAVTGNIDFTKFDSLAEMAARLDDSPLGRGPVIAPVRLDSTAGRPSDRIRIATFNIQRFGQKKSSDAEVMQNIARIVGQFDLVAIQEVQSPQAMPIARLVDLLNRSGGRYDAAVSEPIGRTTYLEQYAIVWDVTRIAMIPDSAYVVRDDSDRMHRPPMVASFETRMPPLMGRRPFRFTVINVHTDPSQVSPSGDSNEMDVLDDVFVRVREFEYQTRGIVNTMMLGDLNVSTDKLGELGRIPGMYSVVGTTPTNTAGTRTYDHILFDRNVTIEYTGVFGVIDFERDFGFTSEQAVAISDHRPVWAEFSAHELPPGAMANRAPNVR